MSFSDHKITAFTHRIADLPDQPNLPADELKARFDSSPEELRQSVNGICNDAARLEARVEGIVAETFGDTIPKSMLSNELQDELDAKAVAATVAEQLATEAAAREATDTAETAAREALAATVAQKCEVYVGTYTGNGNSNQTITLGFQPKAVLVVRNNGAMYLSQIMYGGIALPGHNCEYAGDTAITVLSNGFRVYFNNSKYAYTNQSESDFFYIAFK